MKPFQKDQFCHIHLRIRHILLKQKILSIPLHLLAPTALNNPPGDYNPHSSDLMHLFSETF